MGRELKYIRGAIGGRNWGVDAPCSPSVEQNQILLLSLTVNLILLSSFY